MGTLDKPPAVTTGTHLLLIAPTKFGKTHFCAQAAIDGWELIYFDRDNGYETLMAVLAKFPEAKKRVHYFSPLDFIGCIEKFTSTGVWRYNDTQQCMADEKPMEDNDLIANIVISNIPKRVICVIDGWYALAFDLMKQRSIALGIDLADVEKWGRDIYGNAGFRLNAILFSIQHAPMNFIVHGHPLMYEIKEKPDGRMGDMKEADMVIVDTQIIPASSSNPHGYSMGKYFNQIGHIELIGTMRKLDFRTKSGRVGGGTANASADITTSHSWTKLFGPLPLPNEEEKTWIIYRTGAEQKIRKAEDKKGVSPAVAATSIPAESKEVKPSVKPGSLLSQMKSLQAMKAKQNG